MGSLPKHPIQKKAPFRGLLFVWSGQSARLSQTGQYSQCGLILVATTESCLTEIKKAPLRGLSFCMERVMGIEPTLCAWEAQVLPLNYTRALSETFLLASLPSRSRFSYRLPGLPGRAFPDRGAALPAGCAGCRSPIELHPRFVRNLFPGIPAWVVMILPPRSIESHHPGSGQQPRPGSPIGPCHDS